MNRNRKLIWKEVSNVKGIKVECCSKVKDGNGRVAQGGGRNEKDFEEVF